MLTGLTRRFLNSYKVQLFQYWLQYGMQ